ncbi:hypothetical protein [Gelria sp. Kuro-4]|uniref:hypothetical protein n=1 Tax=Gelria sp. Kuro-4 TaxID=2796927 RepID=UPI001BEF4A27|nr:hypothetical protein [Gelria sp. Kuro-4]BCV23281.1 hypothetical protein kuro4_00540 [Gelria sp. Kuro-4]
MDKEITVKTNIDASWLGEQVGSLVRDQGKSQVFSVLEALLEPGPRLQGAKRVVGYIFDTLGRDAAGMVRDILQDWTSEVEIPRSVTLG